MTKDESKLQVYKSNPLLDMKNDMNLQLQRLFNLYLALINPERQETKKVHFPLTDFVELVGITGVSTKKLHNLAREAVKMHVDLYALEEKEGKKKSNSMRMNYVNVWKRFKIDKNDDGEWIVELEAGEEVLPYMFEIKDLGYLNFSVIYALQMRSPIAEKLYEQCSRYKDTHFFRISPEELRKRLGIADKKSYKSYNLLKTSVLNRCIEEINEKTDILVAIVGEERMHKRGAPVKTITFSVHDNPKYEKKDEDKKIEELGNKNKPIDVEMRPIDATADRQLTMAAYELQQEFGLSESEAATILHDKEILQLSDERVREVLNYVLPRKTKKARIAYIRKMLNEKDADLTMMTETEKQEERNPFNRFEQNQYDFDELEKVLLDNGDTGDAEEEAPDPVKEVHVKAEHLPPYYIVMGDPRAADRLAAYATLGISGDNIKILSPEEHARLSGTE